MFEPSIEKLAWVCRIQICWQWEHDCLRVYGVLSIITELGSLEPGMKLRATRAPLCFVR